MKGDGPSLDVCKTLDFKPEYPFSSGSGAVKAAPAISDAQEIHEFCRQGCP